MKTYTVQAFTKDNKGGNIAGVVLDCSIFSNKEMQYIAKELGFSETAFILKSAVADFKIKFFTPESEVDLCGHATIAAFSLLRNLKIISCGTYTQETKAGVLKVFVTENEIFMEQSLPEFLNILNSSEILDSLNITEESLDKNIPVRIISTGLKDIFIPIKNREILNKISPNQDMIKSISKKFNVIGYHLFALDEEVNIDAYCRNFAPLYGIDEESATGTSNCALACYLYKLNKVKNDNYHFNFIQGESLGNISEIKGQLKIESNHIKECYIGGHCSSTY
ncbi:MAG: PhzF family phenazine biosynthesis protein [Cetobacterium sp.]|uniref:PhzF family phenazine biosynthesis protein n=1 Tax=Cetobacterium sp. TaxID=2071632 RepID=UPI002FC72F3D